MDNDLIKESLKDFDGVWQRVTGTAPRLPPHPEPWSEEDSLREMIREEDCAAQYAASLARLFQSDSRAVLMRHAGEAKRHARRLRAEYFIRTGLTAPQTYGCQGVTGKLASLRDALLQEDRRAAMYDSAAEHTERAELRHLYKLFAGDARRHGRESRGLLVECF